MRKGTRLIKRLVALFIVFLLSIESFGAVVSDNDGSAFITKAEFDSLKNDFQSQIDQYNTSIDSKIDGAIASYLAGINVLKSEYVIPICYSQYGILAPRSAYEDLKWTEGLVSWNSMSEMSFFNNSTTTSFGIGYIESSTTAKPPIRFTEIGVKNVVYDDDIPNNNFAEWHGKVITEQFVNSQTYTQSGSGGVTFLFFGLANYYNGAGSRAGLEPISNKSFEQSNEKFAAFGWCNTNTFSGIQWVATHLLKNAGFTRRVVSTEVENIISVNKNTICKRFSNLDEVRDWYNDTDTSNHTQLNDLSQIFSASETRYLNTTRTYNNSVPAPIRSINWTSHNTSCGTAYLPYFGFVKKLESYSQIWTSKYDSIVDALKKYDSSTETYRYNDKDHLFVGAGAPMVEAKEEQIVEIPISFGDKTKDYDLWVKVGTFSRYKNPNEENDLITNDKVHYGNYKSGQISTQGTVENSIKIEAGEEKISFEMPKSGFVFLKWSYAGNSAGGGGLFLTPEIVQVSSSS